MASELIPVDCKSTECPQFKTCIRLPTRVHKTNAGTVGLMIIGQGGGWQEEKKGFPWCGKAGMLCERLLKEVSIELKPVGAAFDNTVRCRPKELNEEGKWMDRVPTSEEFSNCIGYLYKAILKVQPKILILCGSHAAGAFGKSGAVSAMRGKVSEIKITSEECHVKLSVLVTYHPAAALRNEYLIPTIKQDFTTAYKYILQKKEEPQQMELL